MRHRACLAETVGLIHLELQLRVHSRYQLFGKRCCTGCDHPQRAEVVFLYVWSARELNEDGWSDVSESNLVSLYSFAEGVQVELRHHYQLDASMQRLMYKSR